MELERKVKAKRSRGDYYENNEEEDSVQIKFKRLLGKLTYLCSCKDNTADLSKIKKKIYSQ